MKKPKLIYYNDGRHYSFYRYDPPMSLHQLRQPVDELLGTGVDTLAYGLASGQTFFHDTRAGVQWGDVEGRHNHGVMWWRAAENAKQAIAAGNDVLRVVVDRAREKDMQVLCSMRMNDSSTESNLYMMSRLKREHPEVMIGEEAGGGHPYAATAENYALPEVREERLRLIEEVMSYGPCGLEMDPYIGVFFQPSQAREYAGILTGFVREVRAMLDRLGQERGERLCLASRVYPAEEKNLGIGMDVRAWMREGLVDLVVPRPPGQLFCPEMDIRWLLDAAGEAGTWVYVPHGREPYDDRHRSLTIEMRRAAASNFYAMGADGAYLSDLPWPHDSDSYQTLRELGDPDIYARKSKQYLVPVRDAEPDEFAPERHLPKVLEEGVGAAVPFLVGDRLREAEADGEVDGVELQVRILQHCPEDELAFTFNGTEISPARTSHFYGGLVSYGAARGGLPERIDTHHWFSFDLPSAIVQEGLNELEVVLKCRYEPLQATRVLQSVELRIDYVEPFATVGGQM